MVYRVYISSSNNAHFSLKSGSRCFFSSKKDTNDVNPYTVLASPLPPLAPPTTSTSCSPCVPPSVRVALCAPATPHSLSTTCLWLQRYPPPFALKQQRHHAPLPPSPSSRSCRPVPRHTPINSARNQYPAQNSARKLRSLLVARIPIVSKTRSPDILGPSVTRARSRPVISFHSMLRYLKSERGAAEENEICHSSVNASRDR